MEYSQNQIYSRKQSFPNILFSLCKMRKYFKKAVLHISKGSNVNNQPLITIFIPTFKRPHFLKRAIQSALGQTLKDIQVIVCDNASHDETAHVVAELAKKDSRLHYICHPENIGMLKNYEYCLENVKSTYFSFLSDDDILLPNFCQIALNGFSEYPDIAFFACSTVSLSMEHGVICVPLDIWQREGRFIPQEGLLEIIGKYPVPTTVLFHKEATSKVKIDFENQLAWDCDFLVQLAGQFPFAISKERCGIFFHHAQAYSGSQDPLSSINSIRRLIFRIQNFPWIDGEAKQNIRGRLQEAIFNNSLSRIRSDISAGEMKSARRTCFHLLLTHSIKTKTVLYFILSCFPFISNKLFKKKGSTQPSWNGFEEYQQIINEPLAR